MATHKEFSKRLNEVLDENGFKPRLKGRDSQLAKLMNMSKRGVGKWINGESMPHPKSLETLAKELGVSPQWLKDGQGEEVKKLPKSVVVEVPLLKITDLTHSQPDPIDMIPCYLPPIRGNQCLFAFKMQGNAMKPRFPDGAILVCVKTIKVEDGEFIVAKHPDYQDPIVRQLIIDASQGRVLKPLNSDFDELGVSAPTRIIGVIRQSMLTYGE